MGSQGNSMNGLAHNFPFDEVGLSGLGGRANDGDVGETGEVGEPRGMGASLGDS